MKPNKMVVIINGKGGVGKDTLFSAVDREWGGRMISSITPIKEAAKLLGWDGSKDLESRRFLSDLKKLSTEYNDFPNEYLLSQYEEFMNSSNEQIAFVCIREPENILKFKEFVPNAVTMLITRADIEANTFNNYSDDRVNSFEYDYVYYNDLPLEHALTEFVYFISSIIEEMQAS